MSGENVKQMTISRLNRLAGQLRRRVIEAVRLNGGHLASNLGAVELVLAMHYVFDASSDKLIFDVGHQCYVHKMLTGRGGDFATLRQSGGISGFPNPAESGGDAFVSGHSGTSVSLVCGYLRAKKLLGANYNVVALVGDGALTGGMIYEALNDLKTIDGGAVILVNDNSEPYAGGASGVSAYLSEVRRGAIKKPFESYGMSYIGPIDGHDTAALIAALNEAKAAGRGVIVHAVTKKGKGLKAAEDAPALYHGLPRRSVGDLSLGETFSEVAGAAVAELARSYSDVAVVTAAMKDGAGLAGFAAEFPDRFFDVGICEAHAVTMSAALARAGIKPYAAIYSSFLQRGFDGLLHDVAIMGNPVRFLIDRAGLVPEDGETHQGIFDVGFLSLIPGMTILCPRDGAELRDMIKNSYFASGPIAIRYPKAEAFDKTADIAAAIIPPSDSLPDRAADIAPPSGSLPDRAADIATPTRPRPASVAIVTTGAVVYRQAAKAAARLRLAGIETRLVYVPQIKPLDGAALLSRLSGADTVYVVEDSAPFGGLYSAVCALIAGSNQRSAPDNSGCPPIAGSSQRRPVVRRIGAPDGFPGRGTTDLLLKDCGIDAESIFKAISE
jgi:1-deoxy-D-xylulose-5-phosphate synthase